jgi:hypothetical protein
MRIQELIKSSNKDTISEGDIFELEIDGFLLETTVIGIAEYGPILAIDETGLTYIPTEIEEATYHGKEVPLNKKLPGDVKKSKVYVRDPKTGNIKKVNFGDKKMRIKKSSPSHRKSFRARHHCENPGPKTKARYWSCRSW